MKFIEFIDISAFDSKFKEIHLRAFTLSDAEKFLLDQLALPHIKRIVIKKKGKRSPK